MTDQNSARIVSEIEQGIRSHALMTEYFDSEAQIEAALQRIHDFLQTLLDPHEPEDGLIELCQRAGELHHNNGIPLATLSQLLHRQMVQAAPHDPENHKFVLNRLELAHNQISHGYLHAYAKNCLDIEISHFTTFSITSLFSILLVWFDRIAQALCHNDPEGFSIEPVEHRRLLELSQSPATAMVFRDMSVLQDMRKRVHELARLENQIRLLHGREHYTEAYLLFKDLHADFERLKTIIGDNLNLFLENPGLTFNRYCIGQVEQGKPQFIGLIDIRNLRQINSIWSMDSGDYLIDRLYQAIDKLMPISAADRVYAYVKNGQFRFSIDGNQLPQVGPSVRELYDQLANLRLSRQGNELAYQLACCVFRFDHHHLDKIAQYDLEIENIMHKAVERAKSTRALQLHEDDSFFDRLIEEAHQESLDFSYLKRTFIENNFHTYIQPILSLNNGRFEKFEVLSRICDRNGCISAGSFIGMLSDMNRIADMDRVILEKLLVQIPDFPEQMRHLFINVNPLSMMNSTYVDYLWEAAALLAKANIDITIEITEQALFEHTDLVQNLHEEIGIDFACDDFGTGYSNFKTVLDLSQTGVLSYIKIDGSLISMTSSSRKHREIVEVIHYLSNVMGVSSVAEFIDSPEILRFVQGSGIQYAQGFFLARPMELAELHQFLQMHRPENFIAPSAAPPAASTSRS